MPASPKPGTRALRSGRWSQEHGVYFLTTVTAGRIPWFGDFDLACIMSRNLVHPACLTDAENLSWVVMPDHVHMLLRLRDASLGEIMRRLKCRSAIQLNRHIGRSGQFWQAGYHDHGLRNEALLRQAARYLVANPLRAGLVERIRDYPFWNAVWL